MASIGPLFAGFIDLGPKQKGSVYKVHAGPDPTIFVRLPFDIVIRVYA